MISTFRSARCFALTSPKNFIIFFLVFFCLSLVAQDGVSKKNNKVAATTPSHNSKITGADKRAEYEAMKKKAAKRGHTKASSSQNSVSESGSK